VGNLPPENVFEQTFGANIWRKHLAQTFGANIWRKHLAQTFGANIWRKHLAQTIVDSPGNPCQSTKVRSLFFAPSNVPFCAIQCTFLCHPMYIPYIVCTSLKKFMISG
jgi:hypothetical protein